MTEPKKTHRVTVRVSRDLFERLERWAQADPSPSFLARWLLESGLDRLEEIGLAGMLEEFWSRRGAPLPEGSLALLASVDEKRRRFAGPNLRKVRSGVCVVCGDPRHKLY